MLTQMAWMLLAHHHLGHTADFDLELGDQRPAALAAAPNRNHSPSPLPGSPPPSHSYPDIGNAHNQSTSSMEHTTLHTGIHTTSNMESLHNGVEDVVQSLMLPTRPGGRPVD